MELDYKYAESADKPSALEVTDEMVYLRKDISKFTRTFEYGENVTYWSYQEASLTHDEFNAYTSLLAAENTIKGINDSDNIAQIMAGQETGDVNQLTIMEAIADLYDLIARNG